MKRLLILSAVVLMCVYALRAQADVESYKFDIGAGVGMSGYLGDANESNMFRHPGVAANASFRYLASPRWALRTMFSVATLSGNTADWNNQLPGGAQYKFNATALDLGVRAEINFLPYGFGQTYKRLSRWTPYLGLGLGVTMSMCDGTNAVGPSLPMAFGVKFKLLPRLNLMAEFAVTKVFTDKLDNFDVDDLSSIKSSFLKNNDWHTALTVSFSYEFGPRCYACNRKD